MTKPSNFTQAAPDTGDGFPYVNEFATSPAERICSFEQLEAALTVANMADASTLALTAGDVYTGVHDFGGATSLEIPNSAAPTVNADGEIALDTTVADFSHGIFKGYAGEELGFVTLPIAQFTSPTDAYVVSYNATNDEFELVAQTGGGDMSASTYDPASVSEQLLGLTAAQSPTNKSFDSTNSLEVASISGATYTTVQHMQDVFHSTGQTTGGGITDDTDGTITVAAGTGLIRATDSDVAELLFTDWAAEAGANVALADNDMSYIYVEYNAGSPQVVATITERTDLNTNILLGTVYRIGTTLHITSSSVINVVDHAAKMIERAKEVAPYARVSGGATSETGTRNIAVSAGTWWHGLTRFTTAAIDTSVADTFTYYYDDGVSGFTAVASSTQIDNTQYDDGSGTLATLGNGKYGTHWVYKGQDGDTYVVYGTTNGTLAVANAAGAPASLPPHFAEDHARLVAKIIILKSAATFTSIETAWNGDLGLATATDHGDLTGLADDDHTQYALSAGGRAYTGTHDFGGADDLEIPNSATPTVDTDGQIAIDTTVTDFSHGVMKYFGGEEMAVVAMPIAELTTPTGGHVIAYNATNDEFELVAQAGGGDMSASTYDPAAIAEQLVGLTATQTLTNKTLTSPAVNTPTLVLADANAAAPTTDGEIKFDRTGENLEVGDGVGTKSFSHDTGAATLQNKTVNLANNTVTVTTAEFNTALSDGSFATLAGTETLTNKTVALGSNTVSGTLAEFNAAVTDADIASLGGAETLTNKTLTTPIIAQINDANANESIKFTATASAVNEVTLANAATGNDPTLTASGGDINIGVSIQGKGTGNLTLGNFVFDGDQTVGAGQDNYVLTYDNAGGLISLEAATGGGGLSNAQDGAGVELEVGIVDTALTNSVSTALEVFHTTSGTPAAGIGVGIDLIQETAAGNNEIGGQIQAVTTDVTSTAEDFDLVFNVMQAGALVEAGRFAESLGTHGKFYLRLDENSQGSSVSVGCSTNTGVAMDVNTNANYRGVALVHGGDTLWRIDTNLGGAFTGNANFIGWAAGATATGVSSVQTTLFSPDAGIMELRGSGSSVGGALNLLEMTAPSSPGSNEVVVYAEDNGAGKTRLMALFPTGAAQQLAIEP
jgi:hypothetical protein